MGDRRNNLRHLGMIATSESWRRFWWITRPRRRPPARPALRLVYRQAPPG